MFENFADPIYCCIDWRAPKLAINCSTTEPDYPLFYLLMLSAKSSVVECRAVTFWIFGHKLCKKFRSRYSCWSIILFHEMVFEGSIQGFGCIFIILNSLAIYWLYLYYLNLFGHIQCIKFSTGMYISVCKEAQVVLFEPGFAIIIYILSVS